MAPLDVRAGAVLVVGAPHHGEVAAGAGRDLRPVLLGSRATDLNLATQRTTPRAEPPRQNGLGIVRCPAPPRHDEVAAGRHRHRRRVLLARLVSVHLEFCSDRLTRAVKALTEDVERPAAIRIGPHHDEVAVGICRRRRGATGGHRERRPDRLAPTVIALAVDASVEAGRNDHERAVGRHGQHWKPK